MLPFIASFVYCNRNPMATSGAHPPETFCLVLQTIALGFGVIFQKNPFQSLLPSLPQSLPKMRRKVGKGFYSTAPDAPDGQRGPPELAEICLHIAF